MEVTAILVGPLLTNVVVGGTADGIMLGSDDGSMEGRVVVVGFIDGAKLAVGLALVLGLELGKKLG